MISGSSGCGLCGPVKEKFEAMSSLIHHALNPRYLQEMLRLAQLEIKLVHLT